jgi:hypothetical protein
MIDFPNSPTNGQVFTSVNTSWIYDGSKWLASNSPAAAFLPLTGGTLTGQLRIAPVSGWSVLALIKPSSGQSSAIYGYQGANPRWQIDLGNAVVESGSNVGSDFTISRFSDAGAYLDTPLTIARATGAATFTGPVTSVTTFISGNNQGVWGKDSGGTPRLLSVLSSDNSIYIGDNLRGITLQGAITATSSIHVTTNLGVSGSGYGEIRLNTGDGTVSGWLGLYLPNGTRLGYLGNNSVAPGFAIESGGLFNFYGGPVYAVNGQFVSQGTTAGQVFYQRDNAAMQWQWYATSNAARLWRSTGGDLFIVDSSGNASFYGSGLYFPTQSSTGVIACSNNNFTYLQSPNSALAISGILIGYSPVGYIIYYRNQSHNFQYYDGNGTMAVFNTTTTYNNSGAWALLSDINLKDNVKPYTRGLEAILQLEPISYTYKPGTLFAMPEGEVEPTRLGLSAQQVEPHVPEIVREATFKTGNIHRNDEETFLTMSPGLLIFALINAVKELNSEIEALKTRAIQ